MGRRASSPRTSADGARRPPNSRCRRREMIQDKDGGKSGREIQQGSFKGHKVAYFARRVIVRLAHSEDEQAAAESVKSLVAQAEGARVLRGPSSTGRMVVLLP